MDKFLAMFPIQASTHAAEVDHMTILVHWLMLVLFVGWGAFFLYVLVKFRAGANLTPRAIWRVTRIIRSTMDTPWSVREALPCDLHL